MRRLSAFVLGSAAGGGFPQWNCGCDVCRLAWAGDPRVKPRTQASIAVTAGALDDPNAAFVLINASPDLRQQILDTPALQPRGLRDSPIAAVVLTGAEVDQTAGLLTLRERGPFALYGTDATLATLAANSIFSVLAPDVVSRRAVRAGERFALPGGLAGRTVPGAGQGASLSRRRQPRARGRDRSQCGHRDRLRGKAPRLHSRRGEAHARPSPSGCARRTWCCSTAPSSATTR